MNLKKNKPCHCPNWTLHLMCGGCLLGKKASCEKVIKIGNYTGCIFKKVRRKL